MSEASIGMIFRLMPVIMSDIGAISKGQTNKFDHYNFRGIDDVYEALHPILSKHGVVALPSVLGIERDEFATAKGATMQRVVVTVAYAFTAADGSCVTATVVGEGADRGDKAANKAMSSAFKTVMFQTFCIPTNEKSDSEFDSSDPAATTDALPPISVPRTPENSDWDRISTPPSQAVATMQEVLGAQVVSTKADAFADLRDEPKLAIDANQARAILGAAKARSAELGTVEASVIVCDVLRGLGKPELPLNASYEQALSHLQSNVVTGAELSLATKSVKTWATPSAEDF